MKFFATALVLALTAAAWATEEETAIPQAGWEEALEKFWSAVRKTVDARGHRLENGELDILFRELISDCLSQLNVSSEDLRSRLGPYSDQFQSDLGLLQERLERDMDAVQSMAKVYNEEMQLMVKQNVNNVRHTVSMYLRKYHKRITRDREVIRRKFQEYQELLEGQGQRVVEGLREVVEPVASAAGSKLQEHLATIQEDFQKWLNDVQLQARTLREQAAENTQGLRQAIERKMATIQDWFQAEARKVSHRFQQLIDSVRQRPEGEVN